MTTPGDESRIDMDAKLEAEIQSALGDMNIEDMLDLGDRPRAPGAPRDRRHGVIVAIHGDDVLVEFGPKTQGVCAIGQFEEPPKTGERHEFNVDRFDQNEGLLILSRKGNVQKAEWESLEIGQIIEARCTGTNKGGLDIEVTGHQAFMPAGHVDIRHVEDLGIFVGEKLLCEVIEMDRQRGRLVLSRKLPLQAQREERRTELLKTLEVGTTHPAVITTVKPYGAFADIGGVDGLIHVSDLSYQRVNDPSDVVKVGDQVNVKILKIDREQDPPRIGLGMKQTMEDPFVSQTSALAPGETVSGRITRIADFGAFLEIAPGVEGLIHISELSHERVNRVSSVVKADEIVTAKVLAVDSGQRRISLSLKALQSTPETGGEFDRQDDPEMRRMKAQLTKKFGDNLKGGLG